MAPRLKRVRLLVLVGAVALVLLFVLGHTRAWDAWARALAAGVGGDGGGSDGSGIGDAARRTFQWTVPERTEATAVRCTG
jgi:hypothetical protein